jgi:hypothetical protein
LFSLCTAWRSLTLAGHAEGEALWLYDCAFPYSVRAEIDQFQNSNRSNSAWLLRYFFLNQPEALGEYVSPCDAALVDLGQYRSSEDYTLAIETLRATLPMPIFDEIADQL